MLSRKLVGGIVGLAGLLAASTSAWATTAANTQIVNTASLTYNGGSPKTASVTVGVNLVPAQPTVVLSGSTGIYTGINKDQLADSLTLTSNANGPATYHVSAAMGTGTEAPVNTTGAFVGDGGGFDVALGASVTTVGSANTSGANTLVIPAPDAAHITGSGSNLVVNGIGVNSYITFAGAGSTRKVTAVTQNSDGTFTLTFDGAGITPVAAGTPVYEQKILAGITALPGTVTTLGSDIHVYAQATVTTSGVAATTSAWADNKWTTSSPNVSLVKYVRNLTTSGSNPSTGGILFTVNGTQASYFTSGVTAQANDVLEYVLVASNTSTTDDLTGTALSDALPTNFVNVISGAYGGADVFYSPAGNTTGSGLNIGAAGSSQAYTTATNAATTTLTVNVGSGAGASNTGVIGKEVGGVPTSLFIAYRVKLK